MRLVAPEVNVAIAATRPREQGNSELGILQAHTHTQLNSQYRDYNRTFVLLQQHIAVTRKYIFSIELPLLMLMLHFTRRYVYLWVANQIIGKE